MDLAAWLRLCPPLSALVPIASTFTRTIAMSHVHVDRESKSAKFWFDPDVSLAENHAYGRKELRDVERITREHVERLRNEWDAFCGSNTSAKNH